jgi:hypothetical protein
MRFTCLLAIPVLSSVASAQTPTFIVHTVDGPNAAAALVRVAGDFSVQIAGEKSRTIPGKDVVAIRHASKPLPRSLSQNVILLTNGDRIAIDVAAEWRLHEDRLHFRPAGSLQSAKELNVSINHVAALLLGQADADALDQQDLLLSKLLPESRTRDVLLLADGDRVEGNLKSLDSAKGANLGVRGKDTLVPLAKIKAVAISTEFKARPHSKGAFAQMVLADGGRLGFAQVQLEAGKDRLTGTTLFDAAVEVPLAQVRAIDIRQGPAVYLADLACVFEATPFLGVAWPLGKDASASGSPLQLGQNFFDKGLGMHSQSRAAFKLEGKYRWFESMVGLDERQGQMGRVRLKVVVDGKERVSELRTLKDGSLSLRLDVSGAKELILVVDFADFGDVQGFVNWADARLIR